MEIADYIKFIFAFVFVISLMGGLALVLRKLSEKHGGFLPQGKKHLKVIEILPIDARRKLVLLQCDNRRHLVIFGHSGETVIETGIEANDTNNGKDKEK